MPRTPHRIRSLGAALAAASALLVAAAPAHAAGAAPVACSAPQLLEQPFPGDAAKYFIAPGGHFEEANAPPWTLSGGAATATDDTHAGGRFLSLPAGGSAASKEICVGLNYPTLRFYASADPGARLTVQALFRTPDGVSRQLKIAELTPGDAWQPTRPVYIVANLLALFPNWDGQVFFRFTASGGTVNVDDVYVDPYER